jgi:Keratin, high sulfur B2 protein
MRLLVVLLLSLINPFVLLAKGEEESHVYSFRFVNEDSGTQNSGARILEASATYVDRQGEFKTEIIPSSKFECAKGKCTLPFPFRLIELTFVITHPNGEDETRNLCFKDLKNFDVRVDVKRSSGIKSFSNSSSQSRIIIASDCPPCQSSVFCCQPVCCQPVCCQPVCCQPVCCQPVCCQPVCCQPVCCQPQPASTSHIHISSSSSKTVPALRQRTNTSLHSPFAIEMRFVRIRNNN